MRQPTLGCGRETRRLKERLLLLLLLSLLMLQLPLSMMSLLLLHFLLWVEVQALRAGGHTKEGKYLLLLLLLLLALLLR